MATSQSTPDYYAVLQVHPEAASEIIEAAYRQLMKKYHPDVAGDDPRRIQAHHDRAKQINEAYAVLRDAGRRRAYDATRIVVGTRRPSQSTTWQGPDHSADNAARWHTGAPQSATPESADERSTTGYANWPAEPWRLASVLSSPAALVSSTYNLLPGPYEWEPGHRKEMLSIVLVPLIGISAFALATGRLAPWIGTSMTATITAWALLGLIALPLLRVLPRVSLAAGPSVVLMTGSLNPALQQAHVPVLIAWAALSLVSLLLAARMYVFGVLPTLAICWLIATR